MEYQPYTDLALEESERFFRDTGQNQIPGVSMEEERIGPLGVTRVNIWSPEGAEAMGKNMGRYITIDMPSPENRNRELEEKVSSVFSDELLRLIDLPDNASVLIVGLGNWNATPDALGPRVIDQLLVTRHLGPFVPPELRGKLRAVAALAPGVLGITGIETFEIIKAVVDRIRPDLVIAVDSLCARNISRVMTTIQISDAGIHPGSGVGNTRSGLTSQSLGVAVIAVGVPTVVHAMTIASNTVDVLVERLGTKVPFYEFLKEMGGHDRLIHDVLSPSVGHMVVTPKEIDVLIEETARILSSGLNAAMHKGIGYEELSRYVM